MWTGASLAHMPDPNRKTPGRLLRTLPRSPGPSLTPSQASVPLFQEPQALTCPCRSVLSSMTAQVKVCTQSAPQRESSLEPGLLHFLCPPWAG